MIMRFAAMTGLGVYFLFALSGCPDAEHGNNTTTFAINLARTGQITSYAAGDDGDLQKGAVWPDWPDNRFTNADGTTPINGSVVVDQLTGLMWTKDGNAPGPQECNPGVNKSWQTALDYVSCLNTNSYLGYTDWRLPNINELDSLANLEYHPEYMSSWLNGQGFVNVQFYYYWSSTTSAGNALQAWEVFMGDGSLPLCQDKSTAYAVWPVRTGTATAPALTPATGQKTSYSPGDDGALQKGVAWPEPRFTNLDGTSPVTDGVAIDQLTGLMWSRDGNAPGPVSCGPATAKTWVAALDYIACLNANSYLGYSDWRLPNMFEMRSLVNAGESNIAVWLNTLGFTHQQAGYYWSSTTHLIQTDMAYIVDLQGGNVDRDLKTFDYGYIYVWPVRAGH